MQLLDDKKPLNRRRTDTAFAVDASLAQRFAGNPPEGKFRSVPYPSCCQIHDLDVNRFSTRSNCVSWLHMRQDNGLGSEDQWTPADVRAWARNAASGSVTGAGSLKQ